VLGKLGSTGHVTSPHLHLHVSDGPALLGSEGQPFTLERTTVIGSLPSAKAADIGDSWKRVLPQRLGNGGDDLPVPNSIVIFDSVR
jgi:murein DD-endopeptidase